MWTTLHVYALNQASKQSSGEGPRPPSAAPPISLSPWPWFWNRVTTTPTSTHSYVKEANTYIIKVNYYHNLPINVANITCLHTESSLQAGYRRGTLPSLRSSADLSFSLAMILQQGHRDTDLCAKEDNTSALKVNHNHDLIFNEENASYLRIAPSLQVG